jgi:hypothetical protein
MDEKLGRIFGIIASAALIGLVLALTACVAADAILEHQSWRLPSVSWCVTIILGAVCALGTLLQVEAVKQSAEKQISALREPQLGQKAFDNELVSNVAHIAAWVLKFAEATESRDVFDFVQRRRVPEGKPLELIHSSGTPAKLTHRRVDFFRAAMVHKQARFASQSQPQKCRVAQFYVWHARRDHRKSGRARGHDFIPVDYRIPGRSRIIGGDRGRFAA